MNHGQPCPEPEQLALDVLGVGKPLEVFPETEPGCWWSPQLLGEASCWASRDPPPHCCLHCAQWDPPCPGYCFRNRPSLCLTAILSAPAHGFTFSLPSTAAPSCVWDNFLGLVFQFTDSLSYRVTDSKPNDEVFFLRF